jgi:hypothetical protein
MTALDRQFLETILARDFMFSGLRPSDRKEIVTHFRHLVVKKGEFVY